MTDMVGGGPFGLQAGQWTDDTSMAWCLAESLIACRGFDARDQMARYVNWWRWGYLSSTGECFDIGRTCAEALARFEQDGEPFAGSDDPQSAGNGSLMRLAPAVLAAYPDLDRVREWACASSRTTHAAPEAVDACELLATLVCRALSGVPKSEVLADVPDVDWQPSIRAIAMGSYRDKSVELIRGSGYAVASLEAALWCFERSEDFESAVLMAANLGDDADTTAAMVGQLAGAHYGVDGIPASWRARLHQGDELLGVADRLLALAQREL